MWQPIAFINVGNIQLPTWSLRERKKFYQDREFYQLSKAKLMECMGSIIIIIISIYLFIY